MNRKLTICICYLIAGLVLGRDALNAQSTTPIVVFGPKTYTRSSGKPSPQTSAFTVPSSVSGPFTLTVVNGNGSGGDTVASGRISINGIQILGPSDFNQSSRERDDRRDDDRDDRRDDRGSDSNHSSVIKRTVTLKQNNSLSVELMGEPGGSITLSITGFANGPAGTTVPTLVQAVNTSSTAGNVENTYTVRLPNATLSGNSVVLAVQQKSGTGALSVSDDKGNTYNLGKTNDDGVQTVSVFYALNVAAGAQKITLSFAGGANWVAAVAAEFYNVALSSAFDGASATGGVSTLVTAGNLTTTADHDLIFQ